MGFKKIITGLLLSLLLHIEAVNANGNELLTNCQLALNSMDSENSNVDILSALRTGVCYGIVEGVRNTMDMYRVSDLPKDSALRACIPQEITNGQSVRIITRYLKKNPANLHLNASTLTMKAFILAYPCN